MRRRHHNNSRIAGGKRGACQIPKKRSSERDAQRAVETTVLTLVLDFGLKWVIMNLFSSGSAPVPGQGTSTVYEALALSTLRGAGRSEFFIFMLRCPGSTTTTSRLIPSVLTPPKDATSVCERLAARRRHAALVAPSGARRLFGGGPRGHGVHNARRPSISRLVSQPSHSRQAVVPYW